MDALLPPRYAIESDDEDEFNPLHHQPQLTPQSHIHVTHVDYRPNLVVVAGIAGQTWARGAKLGEQSGAVSVNGVQIGLVFSPPWTKSNIIVSEVFSGLPLHTMHPYAETIIDSFKPSSASLLDSYPIPTYATAQPVPFHDAPIRYLSTSPQPDIMAQLFTPPNLIQATSASFLSILSVRNIVATLILLPSPHIPLPPPKRISPSNLLQLSQDHFEWSPVLIKAAHNLVFQVLAEPTAHHVWEYVDPQQDKPIKRHTQVREGGMYM